MSKLTKAAFALAFTSIFLLPISQAGANEGIINVVTRYRIDKDVDGMNKRSILVIIGTSSQSFENAKHISTETEGTPSSFYSVRNFTVEKVLSHAPKVKVKKGEIVQVVEQAALIFRNGQVLRMIKDNYVPMNLGERYILFLTQGSENQYVIINRNLGRLAFDGKKLKPMGLSASETDLANTFIQQAIQKYDLK